MCPSRRLSSSTLFNPREEQGPGLGRPSSAELAAPAQPTLPEHLREQQRQQEQPPRKAQQQLPGAKQAGRENQVGQACNSLAPASTKVPESTSTCLHIAAAVMPLSFIHENQNDIWSGDLCRRPCKPNWAGFQIRSNRPPNGSGSGSAPPTLQRTIQTPATQSVGQGQVRLLKAPSILHWGLRLALRQRSRRSLLMLRSTVLCVMGHLNPMPLSHL